jgi:hypothetical protein
LIGWTIGEWAGLGVGQSWCCFNLEVSIPLDFDKPEDVNNETMYFVDQMQGLPVRIKIRDCCIGYARA